MNKAELVEISSEGTGSDSDSGGKGHSAGAQGAHSSNQVGNSCCGRPVDEAPKGTGQDACVRPQGGAGGPRIARTGTCHSRPDDNVDPRRRGEPVRGPAPRNSSPEVYFIGDKDTDPSGGGFGLEHGRGSDEAQAGKDVIPPRGLFKWACNMVQGATDRSKTLVRRVLEVASTDTSDIASDAEFVKSTHGRETWSQVTCGATQYDDSILEGLEKPIWRQTYLTTGQLIESKAVDLTNLSEPDMFEPSDIKTTVWYGQLTTKPKPKLQRNLLKGIRSVAAVFLLEAMVLMSAGAQWSGSWTQRMYGTGQADVWEVFGGHGVVTETAWSLGWRPLEPLKTANFRNETFEGYLTQTMAERAPRLLVMECPSKVWFQCKQNVSCNSNAAKQKSKKIREALTPFLSTAEWLIEKQQADGHDFVLETPLTPDVLHHPTVINWTADYGVHVAKGEMGTWWLTSSHHIAKSLDRDTNVYHTGRNRISPKIGREVMMGFGETLYRKEPERIKDLIRAVDGRIRAVGVYANTHMVNLSSTYKKLDHDNYAIIEEDGDIPEAGIEFDLPPELHKQMPKALLSSVRRLHYNSGHPPNAELERIVRLSGGSDLARAAVKGIKCSICRKAAPPKTQKPGRVKQNIGQFNDTVLTDLAYEKDSKGVTHGWAVILDEGTDWCVAKYLGNGKTSGELFRLIEEGWIDWAGPPDVLVADSERGFVSEEFSGKLGRAGTLFTPAAGYAPWQKGQVERKIHSIKSIVRKTVLHLGLDGPVDMKFAGIEAVSALNHRPGVSGVSPGMMLFGQKLKQYGELYSNGEPAYHHLDGNDASTELGRRLQIRCSARQATEAHFAKEMVRKTVAARTRHVEKVEQGEIVFFYRCYPSTKAQKLQAQRGCYLGPGVVIGHQNANAWVSYAGRCYLVAPEHLRSCAPDEICMTKPVIRQGLEELRLAAKSEDFIDTTRQTATPQEINSALEQPAGNDHSVEPLVEAVATPPTVESPSAPAAAPVQALEPAAEEVDTTRVEQTKSHGDGELPEDTPMEIQEMQQDIDDHVMEPQTESGASASSGGDDHGPVTWNRSGEPDNLRWKKARAAYNTYGKRVLTAKIKKKMLDKEIPYRELPEKDLHLYHEAEEKEWDDWTKNKSVRIVKGSEAGGLRKTVSKSRIISLRFVYRDKNASIRTPQIQLPIKAKARLCAQGSSEPMALEGKAKLDSPTVQRIGIMIFLQLTANFSWYDTWRKGDISSAFLQGTERDVQTKGRLFLEPPRGRPLRGVSPGDLLEVLKSVYGLPDAPRAWWEEVTGFLRKVGFQHSRMDVAFMVYYHEDGQVGAMIVLHVDDIMVATDNTPVCEDMVEQFHQKYPFGEWEYVRKQKEIAYTGRQISLHGNEIHLTQTDFVNGRMDNLYVKRESKRPGDSPCTAAEHAEFRSGVGNMHWATSQTRVDHAVDTSRLQKRQNKPTYDDMKDLSKTIKEIKDTAATSIMIRPVQNMIVAAYTDSSLYGSEGELIHNDSELAGFDKHKVYSQGGSLILLMNESHLDDVGDVPFSFGDWRTRASRRVLHSTFAAEAQAAVETYGLAYYYRAYLADILLGYADWKPVDHYGESDIKIVLFTDCKSLFDNLKKDGSVPDDKWIAVPVAALRGAISAGPERNRSKSECRWVPSRWQLADCLTKKGLAAGFRERIVSGFTKLHELSVQEIKRKKAKKTYLASVERRSSSSLSQHTWTCNYSIHDQTPSHWVTGGSAGCHHGLRNGWAEFPSVLQTYSQGQAMPKRRGQRRKKKGPAPRSRGLRLRDRRVRNARSSSRR